MSDIIVAVIKKQITAEEIRVLVAESVPVFRYGLEACFASTGDIRIAGKVDTAPTIPECLQSAQVDVILMDTSLSGLESFTVLKQLKESHPSLPVLLMAATANVAWLLRGIRAGAAGVVMKNSPAEDICEAVRRVYSGNPYIAEPLAERLVLFYQRNELEPLDERLSPREFEVMKMLSRGMKLSEIAETLHLSHQTITTHRRHILEKTGLRTTAEIIRYGIQHGLGEPGDKDLVRM